MAFMDRYRPRWRHSEPSVRRAVIVETNDLVILASACADPDKRVSTCARRRLHSLTAVSAGALLFDLEIARESLSVSEAGADDFDAALNALKGAGSPAVLLICEALTNNGYRARLSLPDVLASIGDRRAVEALIDTAEESDPDLAASSVLALARLGGPRAGRALQDAMNAPSKLVREAARRAIEDISSPFIQISDGGSS